VILQDCFTELGKRTALSSSVDAEKNRMLSAINNQLRRLFLTTDLESEREGFTLTTVDGTYLYRLDARVLRSINFRETDTPARLEHMSRAKFESSYPYPATTEEGVPSIYVPLRKVRVTRQPTAVSVIACSSTSASDATTYFLIVKGYNASGQLITEKVTLTGVTPVNTAASFTSLLSISKDTTVGTITCTSNSAAVTNIILLPGETQKEQWEVRLHKIPDDAYTIPYTAQVIPWTLSYDEDAIPIPDEYTENFLASVTAEVLFIQGDQKYAIWEAKAEKLRQEIADMNFVGSDDDLRFGFGEIDYGGNFE